MEKKKHRVKSDSQIKKKTQGIDQWKALITSFLMQSLIMGTLESYGALYVPIMDDVLQGDSNKGTKSALIGSLTTGLLMGFSPASSWLIDKIGAQLIALFGGVIVFMATLTTSFFSSFIPMAIFYGIIFGIGCSMLFISSNVVISRYFQDNSTVAYGILGLGNGLMNSIMPHVISFSVSAIKVSGTIRILSFLLCFIMFFPLYWNSDKREDNDEPTIGYLPTRLVSRFTTVKDEGSLAVTHGGQRNSQGTKKPEENQSNWSEIKKRKTNSENIIEILNKDKLRSDSHNEIPTVRNDPVKHRNDSNDNDYPNLNGERIITLPSFTIKRDNKMDDVTAIDKLKRNEPSFNEYNYPEVSLFKKTLTSKTSSSMDDEFFMKFTKKSSYSSTKTKDNVMGIFKNIKCFQAEIFQSKPYVTMLIAMPIAMLGYQVPNVHIVKFAQKVLPGENGQLLLTFIGVASAIGPFINGIILDRVKCKLSKYRLYQIFVLLYGMIILILPLMSKYYALSVICFIIGYLDGSFSSLLGPLTIDLVGVHKAGQAIGTFYGFIALSVIIAPPLAGFLYDYSSSYEYAFYPAGVFFLIGGLVLSISHNAPKEEVETQDDFQTHVFNQNPSEMSDTYESDSRGHGTVKPLPLFQR